MPPVSKDVLEYMLGPLGVLVVLILAVWWLANLFKNEQEKREKAWLMVLEMYQVELGHANDRYEQLHNQISELTKQISVLVEHNAALLARVETIEQPVIRLLSMLEQGHRR